MRLFVLLLAVVIVTGCGPADCTYDRDAMMALDDRAFDQDLPRGGWRGVGRDRECASVAADLIAAPLFVSARHAEPADPYDEAWNLYADASESEELLGSRPRWPNNVEVVESLRNCFDRPYHEAYRRDCDA